VVLTYSLTHLLTHSPTHSLTYQQVLHVRVVLARQRAVNLVAEQVDEGAVLGDVTSVTLVFPF